MSIILLTEVHEDRTQKQGSRFSVGKACGRVALGYLALSIPTCVLSGDLLPFIFSEANMGLSETRHPIVLPKKYFQVVFADKEFQ